MPKFLCYLLLALMLTTSVKLRAEGNCPPGYHPTGATQGQAGPQGCAPIAGYQQNVGQQVAPQPPRWESRWGAVATDVTHGASGASFDEYSQSSAENAALVNCEENGGLSCIVEISYANGCVAMAGGNTGHNEKSGETIEAASASAMATCNSADRNCKIYYTSCSLPVQHR